MPKLFTSKFFYAVIVFGAMTLLAGNFRLCQAKPAEYPYRSWTAWAIDDYMNQKPAPQLVFLGSSLVLVPVSGIDADYLNHRVDGALHHRSVYFENLFHKKTGIATKTFNFALPGEMPSDAYMATKFLFKDEKKPNVIVWGVGPRDFMDNLLPSPAATDPFRFLSRFGDINSVAPLMMPEWAERFNYELGRLVYLYGKREDFATQSTKIASTAIERLAPLPAGCKPLPRFNVKQLVPEYKPYELGAGEAFFRPVPVTQKIDFVDNIDEYRKRYKKINERTFSTQVSFFKDALKIAHEQGTRVIVVAMPITDINRSLLSPAALQRYKDTVRLSASETGAGFMDLTDDVRFVRSDFSDTVHLHGRGGLRWMNIVIDQLSKDHTVLSALKSPTGQHASVATSPPRDGAQWR